MPAPVLWLLVLGGIYASVALALRLAPPLSHAVLGNESGRKHALDGLRGVLALSVVVHHVLLAYAFHADIGDDQLRANPFVAQLGSASVALFFMISAYLFGGRIFSQAGKVNVAALFYSRAMRICPLYFFAVAVTVVIAAVASGMRLQVSPPTLLKEIARHLLFGFVDRYEINGFPAQALLGPVWSLRFEWLLYFCLPIMGLLYRLTGWRIAAYAPLLALAILWDARCYLFVAGLAVAQLVSFDSRGQKLAWQLVAGLCFPILAFRFHSSYGIIPSLLLTPVLVAIVQQHRWISLLGSRVFRYVGEISFSIYLLQGIVFYLVGQATNTNLNRLTNIGFVTFTAVEGIIIVAVSTITFLAIEKPFMHRRLPASSI